MEKTKKENKILRAEKKAKNLMKDFKNFAVKGNIVDMATGVIIGTAFTKIVNSLVSEIITPSMSLLTGKINIGSFFIPISNQHFATIEEAKAAGVATINYGLFLSSIIDFLIVAFTIFLVLRYTFKRREKELAEEANKKIPPTKECPYCLSTISAAAVKCAFCTETLLVKKSIDK